VRDALNKRQWKRLTISATGNVVKTWVNGIPAAHCAEMNQITGWDDGPIQWSKTTIRNCTRYGASHSKAC